MKKQNKMMSIQQNKTKYDRLPLQESYQYFSQKLGDVARQLSFSGVAIVWIFVIGEDKSIRLPLRLLIPLGCFSIALLFDLLHYTYGTARDGIMNRYYEKKETGLEVQTVPFTLNRAWNWPKLFFKFGSVILVILGYIFITNYIIQNAIR